MSKPIVWTIATSDSGGGAGIQADLHTFQSLNTYGCSVIVALTAQNSVEVRNIEYASKDMINAQINVLTEDLPAQAIKLGMLGSVQTMQAIMPFLKSYKGPIVCDPVMVSTSGYELLEAEAKQFLIEHIIPCATIITPNHHEAEVLTQSKLQSAVDIERAAQRLLAMGAKSVLLKGGHGQGEYAQDYWTDGQQSIWLTIERRQHSHNHGSGCSLSAALAAALALGYDLVDSLVLAKSYVSQGLRLAKAYGQGPGPVAHSGWPDNILDFPWLTYSATEGVLRPQFLSCESKLLKFYPIVDSYEWLERLLPLGVKTIQLRIKNKNINEKNIEQEIQRCIQLATQYHCQLFINDYWQLAIKLGAYGVHLGQEDLLSADLHAISNAGLRLGISTHCYAEVARAHALRPSYIAYGPIYETTAKVMRYPPQGLMRLKYWRKLLSSYALVAIGGITLERLPDIFATGVEGVAVISAVTQAENPEVATQQWLQTLETTDPQ